MSVEFESGPLSWVKDDIDQALRQALAQAAAYAAAPGDASPLRFCLTHVHQVSGALAMIGLDGAHRYALEIERYVAALERQAVVPAPDHPGLLARALQALLDYVQALAGGAADRPLRLFPEFEAMQRALGEEAIQRSELFFPDLFNCAPADLDTPAPAGADPAPILRDLAQQYRKHLLQWLRAPQDPARLLGMRDALLAVERTQALPSRKTLWWTAVGLLEALAQGALAADRNVRQLCAQLERQLNYLARGDARPNMRMQRDVLYHVGLSAPATERIRDVKRVFELDQYFQDSGDVPVRPAGGSRPAALDDALLNGLRDGLGEFKDCWAQLAAGEHARLGDILRLSESLCARAGSGSQDALRRALEDIRACAARLASEHGAIDPLFPIEMATTLLMLESALGLSGRALENALQGAAAQAAATRALLPGEEPAPAAAAVDPAETLAMLAQVAGEIRANLQRIEQALDDFFRDPEIRAELLALADLFRQVGGAFMMLDQPVAADVIRGCQALVERFARPAGQAGIEEYELVAESLSALGFYLDRLLRGDAEAGRAIAQLPSQLQAALETAPAPAPLPPDAAPAAAQRSSGAAEVEDAALDEELLAVYLAEAGEVHETVVACLQQLRADPANHAALATLRRAFHTLKGSGRTVGLQAMGEVAWAVEQLLNHLLEQRGGVDAEVLDFVGGASDQFQEWVKALFVNGTVTLAPDLWKAAAEALLRPQAGAQAAAEAAPPAADAVVIGGAHAVGRQLYGIFLEEAQANLDLLQRACAAARDRLPPPVPDPARAAHTLGGVARTVGLSAIADLGAALEAWLQEATPRLAQLAPDEMHLFDQALLALQAMLRKAENRRRPAAAAWLCDALRGASRPPLAGAPDVPDAGPDPAAQAARPTQAASVQDDVPSFVAASLPDSVDRQLLEVFLEEAGELMPLVGRQLREWQADPAGTEARLALQRALHTLKGSARMAGALDFGDTLHALETRVLKALEKGAPAARSFNAFFRQYDKLCDRLDELRGHGAAPAGVLAAAPGAAGEALPETVPLAPMMRVRPEAIDLLVNEAGEVSIARSRIERQLETFKQALLELTDSVIRLRGQLREAEIEAETQMQSRLSQLQEMHAEFDPLEFDRYTRFQELTRMMAESVHDVATVQQGLMAGLGEAEAALAEQARMTRQLQQGLMRTRMVPFGSIAERLHRTVRQAAVELGKPAALEIRGEAVEIDRSVLEKMVAPLEHMLRNAIAHGIEDARRRSGRGKPRAGRVRIEVRQEGNEILLALSDDGAGLDYDRIRARARELALPDVAEGGDPAGLMPLIFEPGFSTSDAVTQVSGRGVGLDAVRADIAGLGGRIEVASEAGRGCTFTISLPLTLAVNQTVLVRTGPDEFLLPAAMVEQVQKIKHAALAAIEAQGRCDWAGRQYPLHRLSQLLGRPQPPEPQPYVPLMLLRSGTRRIALLVDEIRGNREIVVKNVGPQLAGMGGIAGATVTGDGRVLLVLDPVRLAFRETAAAASAAAPAERRVPTVMVVDDSLTMRKVMTRMLEREGYRALAAKDGVDALQQLEALQPDVILLDIEMPRMDGFELARAIRGDARTAHIPLIVVSSRTADKHRQYAAELGVDAYLGKPYQEEALLAHIAGFIGQGGLRQVA